MDFLGMLSPLLVITFVMATSAAKDSFMFYFDGSRYITYNIPASNHSVDAPLHISFRMWPENPEDGVLFYSYVDQGDTLAVELHDGSIFKTITYATAQPGSGTLSTGSGLGLHEDEEWRKVSIKVDENGTVYDVGLVSTTSPRPQTVRLGPKVYIGGYSDNEKGIKSLQFYKGCMEDFVLNGVNIFEESRKTEESNGIDSSFPSECPLIVSYMSFYGGDSFLKIGAQDVPDSELTVISFEFRTFDASATLVLMDLGATNISVEYKDNHTIVFRTSSFGFGFDNTYPLGFDLGDGKYHSLEAQVNSDGLTVTLDNFTKYDKQMKAPRGDDTKAYLIGGFPGDTGYKGCLRELRINNNRFRVSKLPQENLQNVTLGRCLLIDRCYSPEKRCTHGGKCIRNRDDFYCNCTGTGYKGPSCHTPMYPSSCSDIKITAGSGQQVAMIDVDGPGPIKPAEILCSIDKETGVVTSRIRSNVGVTRVNGFQEPGSYKHDITYQGIQEPEAVAVIDRAESCRQYVKYTCNQARLMTSPEGSSLPFGWWVGRGKTPHYYWGGAAPDSRSCSCSNVESGCLGGLPCNCDAQETFDVIDDGEFTNKSHLPITQVRFGDTGNADSYASYQIGDVECNGDAWLEKTVTIQKLGSYVNVSKYLGSSPVDVSLQFKTTIEKAQLLYAEGSGRHYISVVMEDSSRISVKMRFSRGTIDHVEIFPNKLNNNEWQKLYLEMTHKHVLLIVGGRSVVLWRSKQWGFHVHLSTGRPILIGGNKNGTLGFVGCLRGLMVNGKNVDLAAIVEKDKPDGVVNGCVGQCESMSLCQNSGSCTEYYATYMCDCKASAFSGCYCGHAVGVRFNVGSWMMFKVQDRLQSSLEYLQLHFKTNRRQGILAHLSNQRDRAMLTVELNLRGGVDISYDDGKGSWGLFTSVDGLANGTPHRVTVRVTKNPDESTQTWDVEFDDDVQTAQATLSRHIPKRLYLASKSSSSASSGFDGCIFGLLYNGVPLLKEVKETPTPDWVAFGHQVSLDTNDCGETENHGSTPPNDPEGPTLSDNSRRPVMITSFKSESVDVQSSSLVISHFMNLVCRSMGYPEPRYIIQQNGNSMTCPHLLVDLNTVLLPPDGRVDGKYQCLALNDWGKSMSEELSVGIPKLAEVSSVIEKSSYTTEGQYLRLRCNVTVDSVPEATTLWSGVDLEDNMADRFYQGLDGDLHFLWVMPRDTKVFKCFKVNSRTGDRVEVKRVQLQVDSVDDSSEYTSKPNELVYSSPAQMLVDIGSTVVLECLVVGHPVPSISWSFEGNTTDNSTAMPKLRGRRLVISNFQTANEGEYQCSADDVVMSSITVTRTLKPTWSQGPQATSVYQDQDAKLYCVTNPLPEEAAVDTEWFINGELLQLKPAYSLNTEGDTLTIEKASKMSDIITYQCNASNQYGYVYGEGYLNVHLGTTIVNSPSDQTITSGTRVARFKVAVSADPGSHVTFTWYHGDNAINQNTEIYKMETEATKSQLVVDLTLVDVERNRQKYAGTYRCVIFDEVREQTVSAELEVISSTDQGSNATGTSQSTHGNPLTIFATSLLALIIGHQLLNKTIGVNKFS